MILAAAIAAGCGSTQEAPVLPWLKVRTHTSSSFLAFAGPTRTTTYFVKVGGFWRQIDDEGVGGAIVLTPKAVLYYDSGVPKLIHEGESAATEACGPPVVVATVPSGADVFDCVNVVAGPAAAVATSLRIRRMNAAGDMVRDQTIAVEGPGRVFVRPMVLFYDDSRTAHFVTMSDDTGAAAACALVTVGAEGPTVTPGPPDLSRGDCSEASAWSTVIGRRLEHVR